MNSRHLVLVPAQCPDRKFVILLGGVVCGLAQHNRLAAIGATTRMLALVVGRHGWKRLARRRLGGHGREAMDRQRGRQGRGPAGGRRWQALGINKAGAR